MNKIFACLVLALVSLNARADFASDLRAKFPQTAGSVVSKTFAFGNFYSVSRGTEIIYVNEDLTVMINGDVIDLVANKSITNELREANRPKFKISDLDVKDAIKLGSGNEMLYVFSDPQCPYCKQLEREFDKLQGVTVYVFPYPLASLHPQAAVATESIWCSKDRAGSWHSYVINGVEPLAAKCDNPIRRNIALAEKNRIHGTPALIFADGTIIPGAVSAAVIQTQIAKSRVK